MESKTVTVQIIDLASLDKDSTITSTRMLFYSTVFPKVNIIYIFTNVPWLLLLFAISTVINYIDNVKHQTRGLVQHFLGFTLIVITTKEFVSMCILPLFCFNFVLLISYASTFTIDGKLLYYNKPTINN